MTVLGRRPEAAAFHVPFRPGRRGEGASGGRRKERRPLDRETFARTVSSKKSRTSWLVNLPDGSRRHGVYTYRRHRMMGDLSKRCRFPVLRAILAKEGLQTREANTSEQFASFLKPENVRWGGVHHGRSRRGYGTFACDEDRGDAGSSASFEVVPSC